MTLPNPCVAPIVFVLAGSEDKWFSVTGFESEEQPTSGGGGHVDHDNDNDDDQGEDEND